MFELAAPLILLLLPLPLVIWLCLPRSKKAYQSPLKVPFFEHITSLQKETPPPKMRLFIGFCLIWALAVFAASGPKWVGEPLSFKHEGYNIMLILDISGSMDIRDRVQYGRPTTRLDLVKQAAEQFVKNRKDAQIGLILFGTRAYLQTPLTNDHASILIRLHDATVGLAGKTTSIGDALGLAVKHMQHVPEKGRVIILLTDGANNSGMLLPLKAAELAKNAHTKVYTIGLSSDSSLHMFGQMQGAVDDLDETTLKTIAEMTGGQYFHATDKQSLKQSYQQISQLETVTQDSQTVRPEKLYYPYPLGLALLTLMLILITIARRGRRA